MANASAKTFAAQNRPPLRPVKLGPPDVVVERRSDGAIMLRSPHPLPPHPQKLTERLTHWAKAAPERVFLAQRDAAGGWRTMTYADTLAAVNAIATALLAAQSVARSAPRHSLRQRHRARAARASRHACRHSLCADLGALFAAVGRFRQAQSHHATAVAGACLCRERHGLRARHRRRRAGERRNRRHRPSAARPATPRCSPNCYTPRRRPRSQRRMPTLVRERSRKFSSPPARPGSPKASSTRSACCAPIRR